MSVLNSVASIKADAKKASYSPLMRILARLGYGARGLIYIMIGFLALDIAPGQGGSPTDMKGAIAEDWQAAWEPKPGALWVAVKERDQRSGTRLLIAFRLVIIKRHLKINHKSQRFGFANLEMIQ